MPDQAMRLRLQSRLDSSRYDAAGPEFRIAQNFIAAPGATGLFIYTAPARCKVREGWSLNTTVGAGASKIFLRKHVAGQVAAASAAAAGATIVDLVTAGMAADATAYVPQAVSLVVANSTLAMGDKLAVVTPATWIGLIELWLVWV